MHIAVCRRFAWAIAMACIWSALALPANAGDSANQLAQSSLEAPKGRVILTITGAIKHTNADGEARFDREMLVGLGLHELTTSTTWTAGTSVFKGALASDVMDAVGAHGDTIHATALNDYEVEIPVSDFAKYGVVFALWKDDQELTARTKGPIWPVYPRDDYPELRNRASDKKWIWQLVRMEIR